MFEAVYAFLVVEVVLCLVLVAPLPAGGRKALVKTVDQLATSVDQLRTPAKYFTGALAVGWLATMKEMWKLQEKLERADAATSVKYEAQLFRAQRNVYLCGFSFLLLLLLYRLFSLQREVNRLDATATAMSKQAQGASAAYKALSDEKDALLKASGAAKPAAGTAEPPAAAKQSSTEAEDELEIANAAIEELRERNATLLKAKDAAEKSAEALKRQAEGLSTEYARLSREKESLENKLADYELVMGDQVKKDK